MGKIKASQRARWVGANSTGPSVGKCSAPRMEIRRKNSRKAMSSVVRIAKGASHGIGHMLGGTANVPHGYTSCVMLPSVLSWNGSVNGDQQAVVSETLGRTGEPAAQAVRDLIDGLAMPTRLQDVDVRKDQFSIVPSFSFLIIFESETGDGRLFTLHKNPQTKSSQSDYCG